jgi:hypothetical protein
MHVQVCPDGYFVIHAQCSVPAAHVARSRSELLCIVRIVFLC